MSWITSLQIPPMFSLLLAFQIFAILLVKARASPVPDLIQMITTSLEEQRIPDVPDVQGVNLDYLQGLHNPSDSLSSIHDISQHIPVSEVSQLPDLPVNGVPNLSELQTTVPVHGIPQVPQVSQLSEIQDISSHMVPQLSEIPDLSDYGIDVSRLHEQVKAVADAPDTSENASTSPSDQSSPTPSAPSQTSSSITSTNWSRQGKPFTTGGKFKTDKRG